MVCVIFKVLKIPFKRSFAALHIVALGFSGSHICLTTVVAFISHPKERKGNHNHN